MIISYIRSSSFAQYDFCQQQYFIDYVLGLPRKTGKKAQKGTITHKVLECLANIKKQIDEKDTIEFEDKEIGNIGTITAEDLYYMTRLTNKDIDKINSTRINKDTYMDNCKLVYGHSRQGIKLVEQLIEKVYEYYSEPDWTRVDFNDCTNFVWMTLEYRNGLFDPRNRTIVDVEKHFEIEIKKDWALLTNGKYLQIKGTIDLITEAKKGIIEVVDWKTSKRVNWTSKQDNEIKDYSALCKDFQLMLYYYAAHHLYPKAKQIIVTIFFIRNGGPFTICFDNNTLDETEKRMAARLAEIQNCELPELHDYSQQHWKCKYLCDYYKMQSPDKSTNMCMFLHEQLKEKGMSEVVKLYMREGFKIDKYDAPGEK